MAITGATKSFTQFPVLNTRTWSYSDNLANSLVSMVDSFPTWYTYQYTHNWQRNSDYPVLLKQGRHLPVLNRTLTEFRQNAKWHGKVEGFYNSGRRNSVVVGVQTGLSGEGTSPVLTDYSKCQARAYLNARLDARDGKVNLAQAFAERVQVANMVNSTARRLAYAVRSLRQGNPLGALRAFGAVDAKKRAEQLRGKHIASQWLEIQYGWKPLLSDIYGVLQELDPTTQRVCYIANGRAVEQALRRRTSSSGVWQIKWRDKTKINCKCKLFFTVDDFPILRAAQLGLTDPLTLAWELLPWSFVVDWFLPIGDYLQSLTALQGITVYDRAHMVKILSESEGQAEANSATIKGFITVRPSQKTLRRGNVDPPISSTLGFKNPLSFTHAANGLALLATGFDRRYSLGRAG